MTPQGCAGSNPRLIRAVWESTRSDGAQTTGHLAHTLEDLLADAAVVDALYLSIMDRAHAEPFSLTVVERCMELAKRYLPRYKPSLSTLMRLDGWCVDMETKAEQGPGKSGLVTSLKYLRAVALRQSDMPAADFLRQSADLRRAQPAPSGHHEPHTARGLGLTSPAEGSADPEQASSPAQAGDTLIPDMLTHCWALPQSPPDAHAAAACSAFLPCLATGTSWTGGDVEQGSGWQQQLVWDAAAAREAQRVEDELHLICMMQQPRGHTESRESIPAQSSGKQDAPPLRRPLEVAQALGEEEVEAIMSVVCGRPADAAILSELEPAPGNPGDAAVPPQQCCALLGHLMVDMWLRAGPDTSCTLAALLLRRLVSSDAAAVQLRAFDILCTASMHSGAVLSGHSTRLKRTGDMQVAAANGSRPETAGTCSQPSSELPMQLQQWLRLLLFATLDHLAQRKDNSESTWLASLSCLCQLCSRGGLLVREWVSPLSPRVAAFLLQAAAQHSWSDELFTHLARLAANLLYTSEPGCEAGLAHLPRDWRSLRTSMAGSADDGDVSEDGGSSFRTAVTDADMAGTGPLQSSSDGGLRLSLQRLHAFGGVDEVARHLRAAPTSEAQRNLMCILLDCIAATACQAAQVPTAAEPVLHVCRAAAVGSVADALSTGFRRGLSGSALPTAALLSLQAESGGVPEGIHAAVHTVVDQLESLAVSSAAGELTAALMPALEHTMACICGPPAAGDSKDSSGIWMCLADLFCSPDGRSAQLAESWLLRLLLAACEQQLKQSTGKAATPALLPCHPEGGGVHYKAMDQAQLARLLVGVLARADAGGANSAQRLVRVVQRLLLVAKLRTGLPVDFPAEAASPPISPPILRSLRGSARTICTPRPDLDSSHRRQASLDVAMRKLRLSDDSSLHSPGASSDAEAGGAAQLPSAERSATGASRFSTFKSQAMADAAQGRCSSADLATLEEGEESEEAHVPGHGAPAAATNGSLQQEEGSPRRGGEGAESNGVVSRPAKAQEDQPSRWHGQDAVSISLATLELLAEWLMHAPGPSRQQAFLSLAGLLLECLVAPPQSCEQQQAAGLTISLASLATAAPLAASSGLQSMGLAGALLAGSAGVPQGLLQLVSPALLARILDHLPHGEGKPHGQQADVRAAILLLLVARCKSDPAAVSDAGGTEHWVGMLRDGDVRIRHIIASFLQVHLSAMRPKMFRKALRHLSLQAQQGSAERLHSTYHQVSAMMDMRLAVPT